MENMAIVCLFVESKIQQKNKKGKSLNGRKSKKVSFLAYCC